MMQVHIRLGMHAIAQPCYAVPATYPLASCLYLSAGTVSLLCNRTYCDFMHDGFTSVPHAEAWPPS
jgi:hypothetical protein